MAETLSIRLASLADITTLKLYLHDMVTGVLLNTGGDLLIHVVNGLFHVALDENRAGLGHLYAVVCDGAEATANVVWDGWLQSEQTQIVSEYPAYDLMLSSIDDTSLTIASYLALTLDPKINEMKEDTDLIPGLSNSEPGDIAASVLLLDWTTIVDPVPARSVLNALRHIRNRWEIQGNTKTVYKEDNMTPVFTTQITAGPDGEITADYPDP